MATYEYKYKDLVLLIIFCGDFIYSVLLTIELFRTKLELFVSDGKNFQFLLLKFCLDIESLAIYLY